MLRILLAEDDPVLRDILSEGLADEGFRVSTASDGQEALALYHSDGPYDVLLVDEEMPNLTGREVVRHIRAGGDRVPVILISGNLHLDADECAALGVGPVLRKPISLADLSDAVRRHAQSGR